MISSETFKCCVWLSAAFVLAVAWAVPAAAKPQNPADLCIGAVAKQEAAHGIPRHLLRAISIAESGRWLRSRKATLAWPWTVTSGGKGTYYKSKSAAIRAVRKLQRRGVRNIDIGCMQVNLRYHPKAFKSLGQAFDPQTNAAYAASFLRKLRDDKRSWSQAVKRYHSATRSLNRPYYAKVYKIWRGERRKARKIQIANNRLQRQQARARLQHKRAERLLADNRFAARSQLWLDRASNRLFKQ